MWGELKGGESVAIFGAGSVGSRAVKSVILKNVGKVIVIDKKESSQIYVESSLKILRYNSLMVIDDIQILYQKLR